MKSSQSRRSSSRDSARRPQRKNGARTAAIRFLVLGILLVAILGGIGLAVGLTRDANETQARSMSLVEHFYNALQQEKTDAAVADICPSEQAQARQAIERFIETNNLSAPSFSASPAIYEDEVNIRVDDLQREFMGLRKDLVDYVSVNTTPLPCIRCSAVLKDFPYSWMCK